MRLFAMNLFSDAKRLPTGCRALRLRQSGRLVVAFLF